MTYRQMLLCADGWMVFAAQLAVYSLQNRSNDENNVGVTLQKRHWKQNNHLGHRIIFDTQHMSAHHILRQIRRSHLRVKSSCALTFASFWKPFVHVWHFTRPEIGMLQGNSWIHAVEWWDRFPALTTRSFSEQFRLWSTAKRGLNARYAVGSLQFLPVLKIIWACSCRCKRISDAEFWWNDGQLLRNVHRC